MRRGHILRVMKKELPVKFLVFVFIIILFFGMDLQNGYSASKKSVITSVSLNVLTRELTVTWNQLTSIEQCYVEVTSSDLNYFYSPTPVPDEPGYVPCDVVGKTIGTSDMSPPVFGSAPLYAVIVDNLTGEILSDYVLIAGNPGHSHSPPQTPPVHIPLVRVLGR